MSEAQKPLIFRGKPLIRNGNVIYYGDMADEYVAMLQIFDTAAFEDLKLPSRVSVQIVSTDPELSPKDRIIKKAEKANLYDAINIASIWLERVHE
ncbi:MAG: hypothetical protein LBU86_01185 [Oscillospiraceae bacterium]|jgi:hypothetical protein|nr:hypothetical protein [Oscillospiraceae bacterium]